MVPARDAAHRLTPGHDVLHEGDALRRGQRGVGGFRGDPAARRNADDGRDTRRSGEAEILRIHLANGRDGRVRQAGDDVETGHAGDDERIVRRRLRRPDGIEAVALGLLGDERRRDQLGDVVLRFPAQQLGVVETEEGGVGVDGVGRRRPAAGPARAKPCRRRRCMPPRPDRASRNAWSGRAGDGRPRRWRGTGRGAHPPRNRLSGRRALPSPS